jgi:Arc/MetJ-type ribon-helix-helix transcriptional regulator
MTPQEFEYIRKAIEGLESREFSELDQIKVLRTISQITGRAADNIEQTAEIRFEEVDSGT